MATLSGIENILLFRVEGEAGNAWKVPYQSEHELSESRDYEVTETKDGSTSSAGAYEGTFSLTALAEQGGETIAELKEIIRERNPRKVEVWEIETTDIEDGATVPGEYTLCDLTDLTSSAPVDGNVEISLDFSIVGRPIAGEVNVTPELQAIVQSIDEDREFVQPMVAEEGK